MTHKSVNKAFRDLFPEIAENGVIWYENGPNCIRVRTENGKEFVFTYNGTDDWKLQSGKNFYTERRKK